MKINKKRPSVEKKINRAGLCFLIPYFVGLISFFIIPLIQTVVYSFNDVSVVSGGMNYKPVNFKNYAYILFEESDFVKNVTESITSLLVTVPFVLIFSMFIAIVLNQKFVGRMFMRGMFFLPVIIASGVILKLISGDVFASDTMNSGTEIFQTGLLEEILSRFNLPTGVIEFVAGANGKIFDLTWKSGIQILLFISALQGIPSSYYEAAAIEGADAWESFWKITFPVLSPTSMLVVIYTTIDSFVTLSNPVMTSIISRFNDIKYGIASASAIIYFLVVLVIIGIIFAVFSKSVFYNE